MPEKDQIAHAEASPEESSLPFFARFLEGQNNPQGTSITRKYPSDWDEVVTHKYPSDDDEGTDSVYRS